MLVLCFRAYLCSFVGVCMYVNVCCVFVCVCMRARVCVCMGVRACVRFAHGRGLAFAMCVFDVRVRAGAMALLKY